MSRRKELLAVEKILEQKFKNQRENEVVLGKEDFRDGKLSSGGYYRLKQQCEYTNFHESLEIIVPKEYSQDFKDTLERMAASELLRIKKDKGKLQITALVCLLIGALWFALGNAFSSTNMVKEVTIVATWVFVWTAVEKLFFDQGSLGSKKLRLLQILTAKITFQ